MKWRDNTVMYHVMTLQPTAGRVDNAGPAAREGSEKFLSSGDVTAILPL